MVYLCIAVDQDVSECNDTVMLADFYSGLVIHLVQLSQRLTDHLELTFDRRSQ